MAKHFEVKLRRSGAGRQDTQRKTLEGIGLRKFGKTVYLKDTEAVRGMLYKVAHLLDVRPMEGEPPMSSRGRERARRAQAR